MGQPNHRITPTSKRGRQLISGGGITHLRPVNPTPEQLERERWNALVDQRKREKRNSKGNA